MNATNSNTTAMAASDRVVERSPFDDGKLNFISAG